MADTVPVQRLAGQEAGDDRNAFSFHDWSRARSLPVRLVDAASVLASSVSVTVSGDDCSDRLRWLYLAIATDRALVEELTGGKFRLWFDSRIFGQQMGCLAPSAIAPEVDFQSLATVMAVGWVQSPGR